MARGRYRTKKMGDKARFMALMAAGASVEKALSELGLNRSTGYRWRNELGLPKRRYVRRIARERK